MSVKMTVEMPKDKSVREAVPSIEAMGPLITRSSLVVVTIQDLYHGLTTFSGIKVCSQEKLLWFSLFADAIGIESGDMHLLLPRASRVPWATRGASIIDLCYCEKVE